MVAQVDARSQQSLELYRPWLCHDLRGERQEAEADLGKIARPRGHVFKDRLSKMSGVQTRPMQRPPHLDLTASSASTPSASGPISPPEPLRASVTPSSPFASLTGSSTSFCTFTRIDKDVKMKFAFPPPGAGPEQPRRSTKRPRPLSDVDGPNTSTLGCKKRRLRRYLITSRLSQPFSLPATHILNREAVAGGDRRFLRLAAIVNARRMTQLPQTTVPAKPDSRGSVSSRLDPPRESAPSLVLASGSTLAPAAAPSPHPSPSEMLRRAAVINRFRLRVYAQAAERGDESVALVARNAGLLQLSFGGLGGVVGAHYPVAAMMPAPSSPPTRSPAVVVPPRTPVPRQTVALPAPIPPQSQPHPLSRAAELARSGSPPSSPTGLRPVRSPRLGPVRERGLEDEETADDSECAFPTSEHESRYETSDEPDEVYADFSVIFGGGGGSDVDSDEEGYEPYEDYMDDLDGIPYTAR